MDSTQLKMRTLALLALALSSTSVAAAAPAPGAAASTAPAATAPAATAPALTAPAATAPAASAPAALAPWRQDRFVISLWVDPVVPPANFSFEYARAARAGFTTLLGGFGATTPAAVRAQAAACAAAGLACIPSACETAAGPGPDGSCVGAAAPGDAVMGYQMYDEPQPSDFPGLANWSASVAARAPGALRFINLLPNYGIPGGPAAYAAYVSSFVSVVGPDVLCFDHYPQWSQPPEADISPQGYLRNLGAIRAAAMAANINFWNFMNIMPYGERSDVPEAQVRWQVFSSLAFGAKGLLYFTYWTPASDAGGTFQWAGGIMTPVLPAGASGGEGAAIYVEGPQFAVAQRVNAKLGAYGRFLLNATSLAAFAANGTGTSSAAVPGGGPVAAVGGSGAGPAWSVLLGLFSATPGASSAVLLHNQDVSAPAIVTLALAQPPATVAACELDVASGARLQLFDDAPAMPGLQLRLAEGDARLLVFAPAGEQC